MTWRIDRAYDEEADAIAQDYERGLTTDADYGELMRELEIELQAAYREALRCRHE